MHNIIWENWNCNLRGLNLDLINSNCVVTFEFIVFASLIFLGEVSCQNREKKREKEWSVFWIF